MTEENETVVQQVVADAQPTEISHEVSNAPNEASEKEDSSKDRNWREMRHTIENLKRRSYELEAELARRNQQATPEEDSLDLLDDDISNVGQTKKLIRQEAARIAQEVVRQREASTVEERMRLKYPDYDAVVNKDNLENLFSTAPELVKMLRAHNDDPYDQAIAAYKLLKKFGASGEEIAKLKENQEKPRSVNSVGQTSALSQANAFARGLTPDLKQQLWNEMKEAAKQA